MEGDECPVADFLGSDDASTKAVRSGFIDTILPHLVKEGWNNCPAAWSHEVDKENGIYEFIKGDFRIFFFKGQNELVAVCTSVKRKSGQKADKPSVNKAKAMKKAYWKAVEAGKIEIQEIPDEDA